MPSISPAFISTVDNVDVPVAVKSVVVVPPLAVNAPVNVDAPVTPNVPPTVEFPEALKVVNAPVDFEFAPIAVPSIAPPFISTLDNVDAVSYTHLTLPTKRIV